MSSWKGLFEIISLPCHWTKLYSETVKNYLQLSLTFYHGIDLLSEHYPTQKHILTQSKKIKN